MALQREQIVQECARVAHEVMASYCNQVGEDCAYWDELREEDKQASREAASLVMSNRTLTLEAFQQRSIDERLEDGWKRGFVFDTEAKTDPCLRPFAELPEHERAKRAIFTAAVRALTP